MPRVRNGSRVHLAPYLSPHTRAQPYNRRKVDGIRTEWRARLPDRIQNRKAPIHMCNRNTHRITRSAAWIDKCAIEAARLEGDRAAAQGLLNALLARPASAP